MSTKTQLTSMDVPIVSLYQMIVMMEEKERVAEVLNEQSAFL